MVKVTTTTALSVTTSDGDTLSGSTIYCKQVEPEHVYALLNTIRYPVPDCWVTLLPFIIYFQGRELAAVTTKDGQHVYLSAINLEVPEAKRDIEYPANWAHEFGHVVHSRLSVCWDIFRLVQQTDVPDTEKESPLHECFAESWRSIFAPHTHDYPHKFKADWNVEGLREWMMSLTGDLVIRPGHGKAYKGGQVYPLDVPPRIEHDRTIVPLRLIAEQLGHRVDWDGESIIIK